MEMEKNSNFISTVSHERASANPFKYCNFLYHTLCWKDSKLSFCYLRRNMCGFCSDNSFIILNAAWHLLERTVKNLIISKKNSLQKFYKKGVLKNFAKFTGKNFWQSLFFNKNSVIQACNFIKKEALTQLFSCESCEIFKIHFFIEHLRWLILKILW